MDTTPAATARARHVFTPHTVYERRTADDLLVVAIDQDSRGCYRIHSDEDGGVANLVILTALRDALTAEIERAQGGDAR